MKGFARAAACAAALTLTTAVPAWADDVVPNALIVQGGLCTGFDCVNNEPFGTDVVRLKENNTRIGFDDTSAGDQPGNDWEITANDSAGGGQSYVAIRDVTAGRPLLRVLAGAPTDALRLAADGAVGTSRGPWTQVADGTGATAVDGGAVLSALGGLPLMTYTFAGQPGGADHVGPLGAQANAAFGVGAGGAEVATSDLAGAALAALKQVAARVEQPVAVGARGATGEQGAPGAQGAAGAAGEAPDAAAVAAFERRLAALDRSQKAQAKRDAALAKRVKKAAKAAG